LRFHPVGGEPREVEAVGGFDPAFQVAFNDVDPVPAAERARLEGRVDAPRPPRPPGGSLARRDIAPKRAARLRAEASRMNERWGSVLINDPFYHPALSLTGERFDLGEILRGSEAR
jgi:hypothetical protein